jgi:hypothetical protein
VPTDVSDEHIASIFQGRRNKFSKKPASKQVKPYFFDPEDGGDMFLRNVD